MLVSIVIRTLNEALHLNELLEGIADQALPDGWSYEVILVDSGSTDDTVSIAERHHCKVLHISKQEFTFGCSLNRGCDQTSGEVIVMISGHCVPATREWLRELVTPIADGRVNYTYGRQLGRDSTKYSETRVFEKFFPDRTLIPQQGFFTNNANAALSRSTYQQYRFDETLTGLEDMHLAKRLVEDGGLIGYIAEAPVYHIHDEEWLQVRYRYEREAIALASIMPETRFGFRDFLSAFSRSVLKDTYRALQAGKLISVATTIYQFRFNQFWGGYQGMRLAQNVARISSKDYFYPDRVYIKKRFNEEHSHRPATDEGTQQPSSGEKLSDNPQKTTVSVDAGHTSRAGVCQPGDY